MCRKHGFTLVEMLFIVLIAAGIIAFAVPAYKRVQERADYNAALGTLLDINNAVESLKRDLRMSTGKSVSIFPSNNTNYVDYKNNWAPDADSDVKKGNISWNNYVASQAGTNNISKAFIWALNEFNYAKPVQNTVVAKYDFYILNPKASGSLSKCALTNEKGVACIYRKGRESAEQNDCYAGAVLKADGSVVRLKGAKCK